MFCSCYDHQTEKETQHRQDCECCAPDLIRGLVQQAVPVFNNISVVRVVSGPCWPGSHADNVCSKSMLIVFSHISAVLLTILERAKG